MSKRKTFIKKGLKAFNLNDRVVVTRLPTDFENKIFTGGWGDHMNDLVNCTGKITALPQAKSTNGHKVKFDDNRGFTLPYFILKKI